MAYPFHGTGRLRLAIVVEPAAHPGRRGGFDRAVLDVQGGAACVIDPASVAVRRAACDREAGGCRRDLGIDKEDPGRIVAGDGDRSLTRPIGDRDGIGGVAQLELALRERDRGGRRAQLDLDGAGLVAALAWATAQRSVPLLPSSSVLVTGQVVGSRRPSSMRRSGFRRLRGRLLASRMVGGTPDLTTDRPVRSTAPSLRSTSHLVFERARSPSDSTRSGPGADPLLDPAAWRPPSGSHEQEILQRPNLAVKK
jgi:hypothetical protein